MDVMFVACGWTHDMRIVVSFDRASNDLNEIRENPKNLPTSESPSQHHTKTFTTSSLKSPGPLTNWQQWPSPTQLPQRELLS